MLIEVALELVAASSWVEVATWAARRRARCHRERGDRGRHWPLGEPACPK
jgi:hypothetical protein